MAHARRKLGLLLFWRCEMQEELDLLIPRLREYLFCGGTAEGVKTMFEQHGMRIISEDEGEFLDWCEVREFAEMPVQGTA
jgi:hypothetical protein